jgi:hypothetical protein
MATANNNKLLLMRLCKGHHRPLPAGARLLSYDTQVTRMVIGKKPYILRLPISSTPPVLFPYSNGACAASLLTSC